jgi:hypothetical protein
VEKRALSSESLAMSDGPGSQLRFFTYFTLRRAYAGMLYRAGHERSEKIEFLNAAAASYSPSIYYKKIKYLLDSGQQFDEVVVFSVGRHG